MSRRAGGRGRTVSTLVASAVLGLLGVFASAAGPVFAADGDLIDASPETIQVTAPAPGEYREWPVSVRNVTDTAVPLTLSVRGAEGALFDGDDPARIEIVGGDGVAVLSGSAADLVDRSVDLARLDAGDQRELTARVWLPRSAGNEYQGAGGALDLRFTATADDRGSGDSGGSAPDLLARTGGSGATLAATIAVAAAGLIGGVILLTLRRKERA